MGKMGTYTVMIVIFLLGYHFMGLIPAESATGDLFDLILNPEKVKESSLFTKILFGIGGLATVGITVLVGVFTRDIEKAVTVPVTILVIPLFFDVAIAFVNMRTHFAFDALALLVYAPIIILMLLTFYDWFRKHDT